MLQDIWAAFWDGGRPPIHGSPPSDTYTTDLDCYQFIEAHINTESVTLETGLGFSTLVFALSGCRHTTAFLTQVEEAGLRAWAEEHSIRLDAVAFFAGPSTDTLRFLPTEPLDLYLIDGGHGYPQPQVDWYLAAGRLRKGGILIVDDLQLWAPFQLAAFLELDPRWERLCRTLKWAAFERLSDGGVDEDWSAQMFLPISDLRHTPLSRRVHRAVSRHLPEGLKRPVRPFVRVGSSLVERLTKMTWRGADG